MPKIQGDWFHSRTSSHLSELAAIQLLVGASVKTEFVSKQWTADRKNPKNSWIYDFSETAKLGDDSIQPSTMQTKIRNWIRLGFLKDDTTLPLKWTQLGLLWVDAIDNGRGSDANLIYRLIIVNALATISFSDKTRGKVDVVPVDGDLVVKYLIQEALSNNGKVSKARLENLIDGDTTRVGKNYSYWVTDLIQSGLFEKDNEEGLKIKMKFDNMVAAIIKYKPNPTLKAQIIKENPLAIGAPFQKELITEFNEYGSTELINAVETISMLKIELTTKQKNIKDLSNKQLERNGNWAKEIKKCYSYSCAIPGCDSEGSLFMEAAHIMPFRYEDEANCNYHRNDIDNGIALCLSCHKMFDAGLFTLDVNAEIVLSKFIYSSELIKSDKQTNVIRVLDSKDEKLILPLEVNFNGSYALYHRENIFLGE